MMAEPSWRKTGPLAGVGHLRHFARGRERTAWLGSAVLGAAAVVAALWGLGTNVAPLALNASSRIAEFQEVSLQKFVDDGGTGLSALQSKVDRINNEVTPASRTASVFASLAPAIAWLPGTGHEISAWASQLRRLQTDLESTSTLLSGSSQLLTTYKQIQASLVSISTAELPAELGSGARDIETSLASTLQTVAKSSSQGRRQRPALRLSETTDKALAMLDEVEDQLLAALQLGRRSSSLLADVIEIGESLEPLMALFADARQEQVALTVEVLGETVASLDKQLGFALARTTGLRGWVAHRQFSGELPERLEFLEETLGVLLVINRAAMVGLQIAKPDAPIEVKSWLELFGPRSVGQRRLRELRSV